MEHSSKINKLILIGIIGVLILAPLAFGSVHVWAYSLIQVTVFMLLLFHFIEQLWFSKSSELQCVKTSVNGILCFFVMVILIQMIPLPQSWIEILSPKTWADKYQAYELLSKANNTSPALCSSFFTLAYYIHPTIVEFLKLSAYLGMFYLVIHTLRSKKQINIAIGVLVVIGLFESLYSIYQIFSQTPKVWWWISRVGKNACGTFIGSNHFAFYLEMILSLTFGFMIAQHKRTKQFLPGGNSFQESIQRIVAWFSPESSQPRRILLFFIATLIGVTLLLSASRGGILSISASMFLVSFLFLFKRHFRRYGLLTLVLCFASFTYGLHIGIDPTLEKFERTAGLSLRLYTTGTLFPIIRDYPLFGVGLGNLRYLYSRYIPENPMSGFEGIEAAGYTHNDWVEAGTEIGMVGSMLMIAAFLVYLIKLIRIWMKRRDPHAVGIGAGVMIGLMSVGFHSYFDFSMHIPANPLTLAALLGIGYAAVHREGHGYSESFFYRIERIALTPLRRKIWMALIGLALGGGIFLTGRHFAAEISYPSEWNSTLNINRTPYLTDIQKAIERNPRNAEYRYGLARYYTDARVQDEEIRQQFNEQAIATIKTALKLNPAMSRSWYDLGKCYAQKTYDAINYMSKWLPLADQCFDIALHYAPTDEVLMTHIASYWVWRSSTLPEEQREQGIHHFQNLFRRSINRKPSGWKWAVNRVWEQYPDDRIVMEMIPPDNETLKSSVLQWITSKQR